jgi:hypothetical protein
MNPLQEYKQSQGTVIGEIRHEIFQRYGQAAYETAHYGWHHGEVIDNKRKIYTLVNSDPIKFLIATETFTTMDITPINPETGQKFDIAPVLVLDYMNPIHLHLEWVDANIPFLPKDALDAQGVVYNLS